MFKTPRQMTEELFEALRKVHRTGVSSGPIGPGGNIAPEDTENLRRIPLVERRRQDRKRKEI
jgi:methylmalonyl-CoA mutase cobalamin-binding subunit